MKILRTHGGFLKRMIAGCGILAVMGSLSLQAATNETTSFSPIFVKNAAGALRTLTWSYVVNGGQPIKVPDDDPSVSGLFTNFTFKCSDLNLTINPTAKTRDVQFSVTLSGNALDESVGSFKVTGSASVKATEALEALEDAVRVKNQRIVMGFNMAAAGQGSMSIAINLLTQFDPSAEWFLDRSDLDQFDIGYEWSGECQGSTTGAVKITISGEGSETIPVETTGAVPDQWKVVDKLERFTVGALTYKNVVVVERQTEVPTGGMTGVAEPAVITYWIAQGVGMVKGVGQYQFMGTPLTIELKSASLALPSLPQAQTITFPLIPVKQPGDVFDPLAKASSKLPVTYVSSNEAVAIVTSEGLIEAVGLGTTTITAYQDGNDDFKAALPVTKELTVKATVAAVIEPSLSGTVTGAGLYLPGQKVTLTAAPGAGFAFTCWTEEDGFVAGTNKVLIFTMASNKTYTANFTDTQKPVVAITLPTASLRILGTNAIYTVRGTAADNNAVTNVLVQLAGKDWIDAVTTNGWKNWSVAVPLNAGMNTIRAYSVDTTGNNSLTSTVSCTYVVLGSLTVTTNGVGTVTRAPATPPEVNQTYTLTATPGAGSVFSNWTGDVSSTNKVLTFTMSTSKTVIANFTDTQKPVLAITTPAALQRILGTNGLFTVKGTASDNKALSNVLVQVNSGSWTPAGTTNSLKNWNTALLLSPGTNIVRAYSMDTTGNCSLISTVKCVYVETGTLSIQTNGVGTITRAPIGEPEIGKTYTLTAAAGAGSVFANWSGAAVTNSTNKVVTFTMTSALSFTATFTDTQKPTVAITSPTAAQRIVTNGLVAVRGTATDNGVVTSVVCRVNSGAWVDAVTTNGWKNWCVLTTLTAGSNLLEACSIDSFSNPSAIVKVSCTFVVLGNLTIQTNGVGSVTRAPATPPEVGTKYTLTAAAGVGSVFSNWTGDVTSTNKAITFTMTNNVAVVANFTDIAKPTVAITTPTALLRITNASPVYTVKGTATDNKGVSVVKIQFNSGGWTNAFTTNSWKNWSVPMTLVTGTNTVRAYSIDATGNNSSTASVTCIYPVVTIDVAAYANLSVGGRWNYKQTEGSDISTRALEVIETTIKNGHPVYLLQEYSDGGYPDDQFFWSADFSEGLFDTGGLNDNGEPTETTFYWQPFMPKLPKTFVPGTDITTKCTRSDMTGVITGKGKIVRERVIVPAGTYDCWKVTGTATFNGQVSSDTSWYAENVGLVKRLQDGSLWELTSYVPPASSAPMETSGSVQQTIALEPTLQAEITVDGSTEDWANVPRTSFSYASVTQEVAAALSGNNIALLLNGCPFSTSDTVLVYFKLRLSYSSGDARHSVDLWTSGSILYGMIDGQVITGFEAVLLNGVLEVKFPVEQAPSQITIEEAGCGIDLGDGVLGALFHIVPPPSGMTR